MSNKTFKRCWHVAMSSPQRRLACAPVSFRPGISRYSPRTRRIRSSIEWCRACFMRKSLRTSLFKHRRGERRSLEVMVPTGTVVYAFRELRCPSNASDLRGCVHSPRETILNRPTGDRYQARRVFVCPGDCNGILQQTQTFSPFVFAMIAIGGCSPSTNGSSIYRATLKPSRSSGWTI